MCSVYHPAQEATFLIEFFPDTYATIENVAPTII